MYRRTLLRGTKKRNERYEGGKKVRDEDARRGSRGRERARRSRTLGGSSQSSGWVSTRPVIIGAYLHEHTSNVPNQTPSHVARESVGCGRVYKARLFLFPSLQGEEKKTEGGKITYRIFDVRRRDFSRCVTIRRSENLLCIIACVLPGTHEEKKTASISKTVS